MTTAFRPCVIVPTFDNPRTIASVVEGAREHLPEVIVVDDGSGGAGRAELSDLEHQGLAAVVRREQNGGKGAAVTDGLRRAAQLGFTHALQIDADGQHDLADLPRFLDEARTHPEALILGQPIFDDSAPRSRVIGRKITRFWATVEMGGKVSVDTLCGFRVYPVEAALAAHARTRRMDFDNEIVVRMFWKGTAIRTMPTQVRYLTGEVSHYRLFRDNLLMSCMHTRLVNEAPYRLLARWVGRWRR